MVYKNDNNPDQSLVNNNNTETNAGAQLNTENEDSNIPSMEQQLGFEEDKNNAPDFSSFQQDTVQDNSFNFDNQDQNVPQFQIDSADNQLDQDQMQGFGLMDQDSPNLAVGTNKVTEEEEENLEEENNQQDNQESDTENQNKTEKDTPPTDSGTPNIPNIGGGGDIPVDGGGDGELDLDLTNDNTDTIENSDDGGTGGDGGDGEVDIPLPSPDADPGFQELTQEVDVEADKQSEHRSSSHESNKAEKGAPVTSDEERGTSGGAQVGIMDQQEPKPFNASKFKQLLMNKIGAMWPKDEKQAKEFAEKGKVSEVGEAVEDDVIDEKDNAGGDIEKATKDDPVAVPQRNVEDINKPHLGKKPKDLDTDKAMPKPVESNQVEEPLDKEMEDSDQYMEEHHMDDDMLRNSNEPSFTKLASDRDNAKVKTEEYKATYRQEEQQRIDAAKSGADKESEDQFQAIRDSRVNSLWGSVFGMQQGGAQEHSGEHQRISKEINAIYKNTQKDVQDRLERLDAEVKVKFMSATRNANQAFDTYVKEEMGLYLHKRYGSDESIFSLKGVGERLAGGVTAVYDSVAGMPKEVNDFFVEGRERYMNSMDRSLTHISEYVAQELNTAKARIAQGRQEVNDYVETLPNNLRSIGRDIAKDIQSKFDDLEQTVADKQNELIDYLANEYSAAVEELDAKIETYKMITGGLWGMIKDGLGKVWEVIKEGYDTLTGLLKKAGDLIWAIVTSPIETIGNVVDGVTTGLNNFLGNIGTHLLNGAVNWLMGGIDDLKITIPDDLFSLGGMVDLIGQILGISWEETREDLVAEFGERKVKRMERSFDMVQAFQEKGFAGIWEYLQNEFESLRDAFLTGLRDMLIQEVIEAGITWLFSLLNPASAFIKAIMGIIDIVTFFVDHWDDVVAMVQAFVDTLDAIANGNTAAMATAIEEAMANTVPVIIGFLASLIGVDGFGEKIKTILTNIQTFVDNIQTGIIQKAGDWLGSKGSKERKKKRKEEEEAKKKADEEGEDVEEN
ncbi:MAG: hypothetical protein MK212_16930, partial [Saprospiraceae bacterium]|nr:hypothetical protein [Saprospiraceae bacterium]